MVSLQAQTAFWPIFEEGKEVAIAFLPFFHIYGQVVVMLNGLVQGSTIVLFTTPDMDDILSAMERYQASGFYGCPPCLNTSRIMKKQTGSTGSGSN